MNVLILTKLPLNIFRQHCIRRLIHKNTCMETDQIFKLQNAIFLKNFEVCALNVALSINLTARFCNTIRSLILQP